MALALLVREPVIASGAPKTLREAVVEPFREFIDRAGLREALLILAFIFLYKLGDSMATALATPFYLDMGYAKSDIGLVAKHAALWPAVITSTFTVLGIAFAALGRALRYVPAVLRKPLLSLLGTS